MGQVKPLLKGLHRWDFHSHYEFPLRLSTSNIIFDFNSENIVKDSGDPNGCFQQLIIDRRGNRYETTIYTDGSRS